MLDLIKQRNDLDDYKSDSNDDDKDDEDDEEALMPQRKKHQEEEIIQSIDDNMDTEQGNYDFDKIIDH
eukprot:14872045-Ditylum_brightwellii.AAC.2